MSKKKYEQQLADLDSLRGGEGNTAALAGLRKALSNSNNYLVAKAAKITAQDNWNVLIPDLLTAFHRFCVDAVKTDPQCWAKNAIVKALGDLGHDDPEVYLKGLRHIQMEPVWGGQEDTAATVRAQCALGLVQCRSLSDLVVLSHLLELLFDGIKTVRVEAARAIGRVPRREAALLLRVRALAGDAESEVVGACLSAILSIEGSDGIDFVDRFLDRGGDAAGEAALALGLLPDPRALAVLKERWQREKDADLAAVLLTAIAFMRLPEAIEFLIQLCELGTSKVAATAIEALARARVPDATRELIEAAVRHRDSATVQAAYEKHFPSDR